MRRMGWMILCIAGVCFSQVQNMGASGSIDWGKRVVVVTGIGAPPPNVPIAAARPNALRAAWADAMRKALETIKGISVSGSTTVENSMVANDAINTSVQGTIRTFQQKGNPRYMSDGSVEATYEIAIDGPIAEAVLPSTVSDTPSVKSLPRVSAAKIVFTGLVVDCKGLALVPAIAPKLLDEEGKEVYGAAFVSREWAVKYGMAGYVKNLEEALAQKERIGEKPSSVKALKSAGAGKTDAVIAKKDADAIRSAAENLKFLSECRVVFVVD